MPNRILRDWTDSERIESIDVNAERFFTRLIMKVDDFGRYQANSKLLKSHLFPLKSDIRETDIARWLTACEKSGLIVIYNVANKEFLQINEFRQVLRQKVEKYPSPSSATQMTSTRLADASLKRNEEKPETKPETEGKGGDPPTHTPEEIELFKKFNDWIKNTTPRINQLKEPFTIDQYLKLRKDIPKDVLMRLLIAMQNRADLLKKYVSANLTVRNWAKREEGASTDSDQPSQPTPSELKAQRIINGELA